MATSSSSGTFGVLYKYDPTDSLWGREKYRGCSNAYGSASMTVTAGGVANTYTGTTVLSLPVPTTTQIIWMSTPSNDFSITGWADASNGNIYNADNGGKFNYGRYNGSPTTPLVLSPVFGPSNATFNKRVTFRVSGAVDEADNDVLIRCMNGFYHYGMSAGSGGTEFTKTFNNYSGSVQPYELSKYILPDGKPIKLYVRKIDGYGITVRVDSRPIDPNVEPERVSGTSVDSSEQGSSGIEGRGVSSDSDDQDFSSEFFEYSINSLVNGSVVEIIYSQSTPEQVTIYVSSNGGGTATIQSGGRSAQQAAIVDVGSQVTLAASNDTGWRFTEWTVNQIPVSNAQSYTFTVGKEDDNKEFVANFEKSAHYITVNVAGSGRPGNAAIYINDRQFPGATVSTDNVVSGDTIEIVATANPGYTFSNWSCSKTGDNGVTSSVVVPHESESVLTVDFAQDGDLTYTANFTEKPTSTAVTVNSKVSLNDSGILSDIPNGISYTVTYTGESGDEATADAPSGPSGMRIKIVNGRISLAIDDTVDERILTVGGIRYRYTFDKFYYRYGYDSDISTWSEMSLLNDTWTHTVDTSESKAITISAVYTRNRVYSLETRSELVDGTEISSFVTITQTPSPDLGFYDAGQTVNIVVPNTVQDGTYKFKNWIINGTTQTRRSYEFTINQDTRATAVFDKYCTVTAEPQTSGTGVVTISPSPGSGTGWPTDTIPLGTTATFTATPSSGYVITGWTLNGQPISQDQITDTQSGQEYARVIDDDTAIQVSFAQNANTITVNNGIGGQANLYDSDDGESWDSIGQVTGGNTETFSTGKRYVKVNAEPNAGYEISSMGAYYGGGYYPIENGASFEPNGNATVVVEYRLVSWLSTLVNIIKVY